MSVLIKFVLVTGRDNCLVMDSMLEPVLDCQARAIERFPSWKFRIERWTYTEGENGHELLCKATVD
jgi:hypothetical protein